MKKTSLSQLDESLTSDEPCLDISSLIDVCFLLLIYFLVTTTIQPREQDLKMALPPVIGDAKYPQTPMIIELRQGGEVVVNPGDAAELFDSDVHNRSLPQLKNRLSLLCSLGGNDFPSVMLQVHDEVQQQRYIDVINCLAGAGVQHISLRD
ncbi:biopolymer transporter ExbD [Verrucomicrobiaceae bacterium N1E253]|uniref:Biopolymer transporter ExbD n=1 Tax=Oceaniferula marina TaxID=2748318 RepID=A0A851GII0_9BACT|nr:biopolymer transporter ExbD [Oceaniferula marina]NWK56999.1 biopolymer transporter ExbD [Oceaniferula marina]